MSSANRPTGLYCLKELYDNAPRSEKSALGKMSRIAREYGLSYSIMPTITSNILWHVLKSKATTSDAYLTPQEAAFLLRTTEKGLRNQRSRLSANAVPFVKKGGRILYRVDTIIEHLNEVSDEDSG